MVIASEPTFLYLKNLIIPLLAGIWADLTTENVTTHREDTADIHQMTDIHHAGDRPDDTALTMIETEDTEMIVTDITMTDTKLLVVVYNSMNIK